MTRQHYALIEKEGCHALEITSQQPKTCTGRDELETIYQNYADLYPNPRLMEEKRQRDTLLQAARAASTARQETKKPKKGFFTFLFGTREEEPTPQHQDANLDESELQYTEIPNEHDDGRLCGTQQSLDVTCIPSEVYHVGRSHLASTNARRFNPNQLRWGPNSRILAADPRGSVIYTIANLGEIAELGGSESQLLPTSDRDDLIAYAQRQNHYDVSAARGTVVSQNCIAVSWGFIDGLTVFYRRKFHGWEAVWWVGPSEPVLENLSNELLYDDAEEPQSALLQITDCVALHVESPTNNETAATLVVSRLGGYIELVPLPMALWRGPILQKEMPSSRRGKRRHHYASKNIARPANTLALTTFDYHLDIQALEIYRTNVNNQTEWNQDLYPDGPPSEFLLVASGVSVDGGYGETMTFWGISTLFAEGDQSSSDDFSIHSRLLEAIWTGTGSPVSTFCTPKIMSNWRTPRHVELKDTAATTAETEDSSTKPLAPVTTLSVTAPIVSMKFSNAGPFLSVLDWNGGVQIFDCSVVARLAAQCLAPDEHQLYQNLQTNTAEQPQEQPAFDLVRCILLRSQIGKALQKFAKLPSVRTMHWLESNTDQRSILPSIVLVLSKCKKLAVLSFEQTAEGALNPSIVSVPFPVSGVAVESLADNCLSFVSKTNQRLRYFVMEELQPMAIVKTLARESKFEEAIQSASKLSTEEQDELAQVVVDCHRHLWETKRDANSLIATKDELYILGEALSICESATSSQEFSTENLRSLLKLALEIVSNHGEEKERVKKAFVRLGTFELLCKYYESNVSLKQFQEDFLHVNMIDLAIELANRGDIPALSIVLYRHRLELHEKLLDVLGSLPLAMKSTSFCHLLPVIRNDSFADLFLDPIPENTSEMPWSHMPQYILEKHMVSIAFDRFDEMLVLENNQLSNDPLDESPTVAMVDWFVKRANKMQTFIGNVDDVVNFTKIGMRCVSHDTNDTNADFSSVQQLHTTGRTALSLKRMLLDEDVSIDGDGINTEDLMSMELVELLDLFLDCADQTSVVRYRFDEYIQPLVMEMSASSSSDQMDESLADYCLNKVKNCDGSEAKDVLVSVVAIAEISKASIPKKNRLIKNKNILIDMVLNVVEEISKTMNAVTISMNEKRQIVESIWSLYETLPAHPKASASKNEAKMQKVYDDLVGLDILSRWRGCNPFSFFNKCRSGNQDEGTSLVLEICESFTSTITTIPNPQEQVSLLQDLLCDVMSLNEVVFKNSVDLANIICEYLIPIFLEKGYFELVASYLESEEKIVDRDQVIRNVIEYVDEATFSDGDNIIRITNAMKCQDALGPILPEIQSLVQSNRRYLDASHFISTVLLDGNQSSHLLPSDLKEMAPLDVLETVLGEFPECIACRCLQWLNPEHAQDANKLLRRADMMGGQDQSEPPELPGGAVFHLATILGLKSHESAVIVKARVIHYALQGGYHGAGAAIARTLLHEKDFDSSSHFALDEIKLGAVANLVLTEDYKDIPTKKELCETVLRRFDRKVSFEHSEYFDIILRVSSKLDLTTSRFEQESCTLPPERKDYLLSRPMARLYRHTFHEYNKDMHYLFKDLANQASDGVVHDSLMDVLSRYIFFWLIHDSITTKNVVDLKYKEDSQDYLKFACGLVLQIPSFDTAESSLRELQEIALDQIGRVATEERFQASDNFVSPNPDILRHLIQRGFTENAARRAATMTGNVGHNEAMAWAVGHAMDPDINAPMIMLKSSNRRMIDESSIQALQKSLIQLSNILQDPLSRSAFLESIIGTAPRDSTNPSMTRVMKSKAKAKPAKTKATFPATSKSTGPVPPPKKTTENKSKPLAPKPSEKENGTEKPVAAKLEQTEISKPVAPKSPKPPPKKTVAPKPPTPKPPKEIVKPTPPAKANGRAAPVAEKTVVAKPVVPKSPKPPPKKVVGPKPPTPKPPKKIVEIQSETEAHIPAKTEPEATPQKRKPPPPPPRARPVANKPVVTTIEKANSSESKSSGISEPIVTKQSTAKPTTRPAMDREALLRRGKAALDKLKREKEGSTSQKSETATNLQVKTTIPISKTAAKARSPTDREALLKRGQAALQKMRNQKVAAAPKAVGAVSIQPKTAPPAARAVEPTVAPKQSSNDPRRKLIEEGRQLLLQAKRNKASSSSTVRVSLSKAPPPPKAKATPPAKATTPQKAMKLTTSEDKNDAGWDFDDFDDF